MPKEGEKSSPHPKHPTTPTRTGSLRIQEKKGRNPLFTARKGNGESSLMKEKKNKGSKDKVERGKKKRKRIEKGTFGAFVKKRAVPLWIRENHEEGSVEGGKEKKAVSYSFLREKEKWPFMTLGKQKGHLPA